MMSCEQEKVTKLTNKDLSKFSHESHVSNVSSWSATNGFDMSCLGNLEFNQPNSQLPFTATFTQNNMNDSNSQ